MIDYTSEMTALNMTREQVIKMYKNQGYSDGRASATMTRPIHKNWDGKPHFNPCYEEAYWKGYNKAAQQL